MIGDVTLGTVNEQLCCKSIELLAVSMRLHYFPREFSHHNRRLTASLPAKADAA